MKNFNLFIYIAEMTREIDKAILAIENALDVEDAQRFGNRVLGLVDSLTIMANTIVESDTNGTAADIQDTADRFMAEMLQAMCNVALRVKDDEAFFKYASKRDEYRG